MKLWIVFYVNCDGGRIGNMWKYRVCKTEEDANKTIKMWTKPIDFSRGLELFKEYTLENKDGWVCWPAFSFVYMEEINV